MKKPWKTDPQLADARRRLDEYGKFQRSIGQHHETKEFNRLNNAVIKAERKAKGGK